MTGMSIKRQKISKNMIFALILFVGLLVAEAFSSTPIIREYSTYSDFIRGKIDGLMVGEKGELVLIPEVKVLINSGEPFLWSIAVDHKGRVFAGSGNDGKIYLYKSPGDTVVYFDAEELQVYCLAIDANGVLYAGTSPNGKVYRITGIQQATVYADPEDTYIWDLDFDKKGNLYLATGHRGRIYRVDVQGKMTVFFESEQAHFRSILVTDEGNVYAGSADDGYIYRITADGKGYVLYDTSFREVHDLASGSDGAVYAAAMGEEQPAPVIAEIPSKGQRPADQESEPELSAGEDISLSPQEIMPGVAAAFGRQEKSALLYLSPEGVARDLWIYNDERVQSIAVDRQGILWVGTGDNGKLYQVTLEAKRSFVLQTEEAQITRLVASSKGQLYFSTANMGRLRSLGPDMRKSGTLLSETLDARALSHWGSLSVEADLPAGTSVKFWLRSGNTETPGTTWSDWVGPYENIKSQPIQCPDARFLQWKCELASKNEQLSPVVHRVTIAYLQQNLPPMVTDIIIHDANERYIVAEGRSSSLESSAQYKGIAYPQQISKAQKLQGYRSIDWIFEDPNGDRQTFDIFYRQIGENFWKVLSKEVENSVYAWDTHQMPDGRYEVQITATDGPANPPALTRTGEKVSEPFWIDNTGPNIDRFEQKNSAKEIQVAFTVSDAIHPVRKVEYSLDAEKWQLVYPVDGICDSKSEEFRIQIPRISADTRTLVVRAVDDFDNIGYGYFNARLK